MMMSPQFIKVIKISFLTLFSHPERVKKTHTIFYVFPYTVQETSGSQTTLVGSQYARNRKATQQTKQLLFDCVTEVVESHRRRDQRGQQMGRILDPEQLWKLICENIWAWSQDPIDETNVNQLVHFDSEGEWRGFQGVQQAQEIGVIISEIMLEDIRDEIVRDLVISFK